MAATGKTPILLYGSTTATNQPSAGNLTNSSDGCEIAINVADKNLFFKDSTNTVNTVPIRQSSASSNGWLSSTDWSTFNSKQPAGAYVTSVTGTAPVVSSGGTTPAISMAAASASTNGYLTSTDWNTFNGKVSSQWTTSGSNIYYSTGNVGINNGSPSEKLDVAGNGQFVITRSYGQSADIFVAIGGTDNGYVNSGAASHWRQYVSGNDTGQALSFDAFLRGTGWTTRTKMFSSGGVSIGNTTDPGAGALSVTGLTYIGSTTSSAKMTVAADLTSATNSNRAAIFVGTTGADSSYEAVAIVKKANDSTTANRFQAFYINGGNAASGYIVANGANQAAFASSSDARLKENITALPNQLANIMALRPVEFDYKDGTGHQIGFIAQELQQIYPDDVSADKDGYLSVAGWSKKEARLIKAIQEQQSIIESLVARIEILENK